MTLFAYCHTYLAGYSQISLKVMAVTKDEGQQAICEQGRRIRDLMNEARKRYTLIKKPGLWHQLCSCLAVIGDTELAIAACATQELGDDKGSAYLAV